MTDLSSVLPTTAPVAPAPVTGAAATASDGTTRQFQQTLGAFLDAQGAASDAPPLPPANDDGLALAADGKDLPPRPDDDNADPAASESWLAALLAPPPAASGDPVVSHKVAATPAIAISSTHGMPLPASPPSHAAIAQSGTDSTEAVAPPARPAFARLRAAADLDTHLENPSAQVITASTIAQTAGSQASGFGTIAQPTVASLVASALARATAPAPVANDTIRAAVSRSADDGATAVPIALARIDPASRGIEVNAVPQPAGQIFAAAIATASAWRARTTQTPDRDTLDGVTTLATTPTAVQERAIVHAAGDAQGSALDLTRDAGLQRMIDRIETLRDDADASDTRIRLVPDALGSVDIAVRQEGDRVHVHFTAEEATTRTLIADAQPRLSELAAARGVRIGETSIAAGSGNPGGNAAPQPQAGSAPQQSRRSAAVALADDTPSITDSRLA